MFSWSVNHFVLGYLSQLIFTGVIVSYFISVKGKTAPARWLTLTVLAMMNYSAVGVVAAGLPLTHQLPFTHLQVWLVSGMLACALQFACRFPPPPVRGKISRWLLVVSFGGLGLWGLGLLGVFLIWPAAFLVSPTPAEEIWPVVFCLSITAVFVQRIFQKNGPPTPSPQRPGAQAAWAFSLIGVLGTLATILLLLDDHLPFLRGQQIAQIIPTFGLLLILFTVTAFYLNQAPETTTLLAKIVGVALLLVLLILNLVTTLNAAVGAPLGALFWLMLGASALVVWGLPLVLRPALIRPLNNLVAGVQAVNQGQLNTQVPVAFQDEIGVITATFNKMVDSVRQQEEVLALRLAERTQEVAEREHRLAVIEERERIGRELHDDLGQVLGYVNAQSHTALAQLGQGQTTQTRASLEQLARVAQQAHGDVRQYILGIRTTPQARPTAPADFLVELDEYFSSLHALYGFTVTLQLPPDWQTSPFAPEVETQLLRIIQEALTNSRKYAGTGTAAVTFTSLTANMVQVVVADAGAGFDLSAVDSAAHFGLSIMRERAARVGGAVLVTSTLGAGTTVTIDIPCALPVALASPVGVRVVLADDHLLYLEGLSNLLATRGVQVVGKAHDGLEAQALARTLLPDLMLMDVHMPNCDGLEATRRIKAELPNTKVVVLTMSADEAALFEALKAGAAGYLLKNLDGEQFFVQLQRALAGETALSPELAQRVLTEFTAPTAAADAAGTSTEAEGLLGLTDRQREVLALAARGKSNKEIAAELFITENTVKFHIKEILKSLQLRSRHELAHYLRMAGGESQMANG